MVKIKNIKAYLIIYLYMKIVIVQYNDKQNIF